MCGSIERERERRDCSSRHSWRARFLVFTGQQKKSPAKAVKTKLGDRWRVVITSLEGPASKRNDLHGSCSCREIKEETAASRR